MFENRRWLVIPTTITGLIDFNEVLESSVENLRLSIDGTQTFVKYEIYEVTDPIQNTVVIAETGEEETFITEPGIYGRPSIYSEDYDEYNHEGILSLLSTNEWTSNETIE